MYSTPRQERPCDELCDALESGRLAAAALDRYEQEPLPAGARLRGVRGVVMTPHLGGASRQVAEKAARIAAAEVARYAGGSALAHCLT